MTASCGCRNHMGKEKIMHKSQEAAMAMILSRHIKHGPHEVYRCPKNPNVWHVRRTKRKTRYQ